MSSISQSAIIFACVFGGACIGAVLRKVLPDHHLNQESKDVVKLGTGLVATMTALLLGLLVASAKNSYDADTNEVIKMSAKIVLLDRMLADYGDEAKEARVSLRRSTEKVFHRMWPEASGETTQLDPTASPSEETFAQILQLAPKDDVHVVLKSQAISIAAELGQMRWLIYEQTRDSLSLPFMIAVVAWLTVIFISFGMFAPMNPTVMCTLIICALSVSCALFLLMELDQPFDGLIQISSEPMRKALAHLGR